MIILENLVSYVHQVNRHKHSLKLLGKSLRAMKWKGESWNADSEKNVKKDIKNIINAEKDGTESEKNNEK